LFGTSYEGIRPKQLAPPGADRVNAAGQAYGKTRGAVSRGLVSVVRVRAGPLPSIAGVWSVDDGDARSPAESRREFRAGADDCNSSKAGAPHLTAVAPGRVRNAGAAVSR
jgi:hypothetical protein